MRILAILALFLAPARAGGVREVDLGQKVTVKSGEEVKLKGRDYLVTVGASPCPYFFSTEVKDASTANLTIHN